MRFKDFLLAEAGHTIIEGGPIVITVLVHGQPMTFRNVEMVDPCFELMNLPKPPDSWSKAQKFMGEVDFSLPLVGPKGNITMWLTSRRASPVSGSGSTSLHSIGYAIRDFDWSKARIYGSDGRDMMAAALRGDEPLAAVG